MTLLASLELDFNDPLGYRSCEPLLGVLLAHFGELFIETSRPQKCQNFLLRPFLWHKLRKSKSNGSKCRSRSFFLNFIGRDFDGFL